MDPEIESPKEKIAAVILAAGASIRMGQPKLLMPWNGKPILHYAVSTALESGLSPVLVITGKYHDELAAALYSYPVTLVHNTDWLDGQSTSVRRAILSLPKLISAVIFLLGDQPKIPAAAIQALVGYYIKSNPRPSILAPVVNGRRANPVLFDRSVFPDLLKLEGDAGARQVFAKHPPVTIEMNEPGLLFDVDSPEDYAALNT